MTAGKVPEITAAFWVVKVLTTGVGESASDYLATRLGPVPAVALAAIGLVAALAAQFASSRHRPGIYWTAVLLVSVVGTMVADFIHVVLHVPYLTSTLAFAVVLAAVLALWYATERSLSFHELRTRRREVFYWLTVMATFAFGTAVGDLTAATGHLGYLTSGLAFAAVIALPAIAYRWFGLAAVPAFWCAYVLTRPLGASFADWAAASPAHGGLGLGTGTVTITLVLAIALLVGALALSRREGGGGLQASPADDRPRDETFAAR
ncbi:hypothetical protein ACFV3R_31720 [Streptomyces sp. NPDC059740]|uniref:COG4705 family protein n=1 Tax=Streptomyces sp. NPDC059740 TaxID=3346926 RepID=UPI003667253B